MIELSFVGNKEELLKYIGREICEFCFGSGIAFTAAHYYGDNLSPSGIWEFKETTCECKFNEE